jgi:hypothetical protein
MKNDNAANVRQVSVRAFLASLCGDVKGIRKTCNDHARTERRERVTSAKGHLNANPRERDQGDQNCRFSGHVLLLTKLRPNLSDRSG